jgi:hypothetical protein
LFPFSLFALGFHSNIAKQKHREQSNHLVGFTFGMLASTGSTGSYITYEKNYFMSGIYNSKMVSISGIDGMYMGVQMHLRMLAKNNNHSISLHAHPTLGLALLFNKDATGYGNLQVPLFFNYNIGLGANASSTSDKGFTLGLGA